VGSDPSKDNYRRERAGVLPVRFGNEKLMWSGTYRILERRTKRIYKQTEQRGKPNSPPILTYGKVLLVVTSADPGQTALVMRKGDGHGHFRGTGEVGRWLVAHRRTCILTSYIPVFAITSLLTASQLLRDFLEVCECEPFVYTSRVLYTLHFGTTVWGDFFKFRSYGLPFHAVRVKEL
jgi:hypothetical protein